MMNRDYSFGFFPRRPFEGRSLPCFEYAKIANETPKVTGFLPSQERRSV